MRRAAARSRRRRVRSSSVLPFVGSAAPIAAFMATKGGGRTGPAPGAKRRAEARAEDGGGRLFCFAMESAPWGAPENSRPSAIAGTGRLPQQSPSQEGRGRGSLRADGEAPRSDATRVRRRRRPRLSFPAHAPSSMKRATSCGASCTLSAARSASTPSVRRSSLKSPSCGDKAIASIPASVARSSRRRHRAVARGIVVAGDVEAAKGSGKQDGGEVRGRKRRRHRHGRHDASERQHGFDAFAGGHDIVRDAEADGVAEKMAHRPPRRFDRRLASPVGGEPGPMRAGDLAVEIGDSGDHRGPGLGRRTGVWPVVAAGMEAEASGSVQSRNAAVAQIRFHDCARNRLRHGEQSPRGFRGSRRQRRSSMSGRDHRLGSWKLEEAPGLIDHIAEVGRGRNFRG